MKKKVYQEPETTVVELQHGTVLLEGSQNRNVNTRGRINNWKDGDTTDEDIYM